MIFFDAATLRLKQQLKLVQDKEIAPVLGMTPRAWAGRKKNSVFPETELYALAAKRPDLHLDVHYILTGIESSAQARLDAMSKHIEAASDAGLSMEQVRASVDASDPGNIANILELLRKCRHKERAAVHDMLKTIVDLQDMVLALQPKSAARASAKEAPATGSNNMVNSAPGAVQIKGSGNSVRSRPKK